MRGNPTMLGAARLWGTLVARDDQKSPEAHLAMKQRLLGRTPDAAITSLTVQVKQWPTPKAFDSVGGPEPDNRHSPGLLTCAVTHTTSGPPAATTPTDGESGSQRVDLNPRFVEALMGVPQNWLTPSTSVETGSFQRWQRLHSLSSPDGSVSTCGATT